MKSILQNEKVCYITGSNMDLHEHHIFGGGNRKLSEKYGLKVWLRADWNNMADYGVHFDPILDKRLKSEAQLAAMERYGWNVEDFIRIFGRNYL